MTAFMMETNGMELDDTSILSFCNGEDDEDCAEIVDLLLNPFDEEDDNLVVNVGFDDQAINNMENNDVLMMDDNVITDPMAEGQEGNLSSLRQISAGSSNPNTIVTPSDATTTSMAMGNAGRVESLNLTNRLPMMLYLSCNPDHLNDYQVEIRKLIQLFEATPACVEGQRVKGRNRAIVLGQVGVQCWFCGHIFPPQNRAKGSTYFPQKLTGIYQACQILSTTHLLGSCPNIHPATRDKLQIMQKTSKASRTAGKDYWASTAEALGVYEDEYGLRFEKQIPTTYSGTKAKERARGKSKDDNFKY